MGDGLVQTWSQIPRTLHDRAVMRLDIDIFAENIGKDGNAGIDKIRGKKSKKSRKNGHCIRPEEHFHT